MEIMVIIRTHEMRNFKAGLSNNYGADQQRAYLFYKQAGIASHLIHNNDVHEK